MHFQKCNEAECSDSCIVMHYTTLRWIGVDALKGQRKTCRVMHRVLANPLFMQLCTAPCSPLLSPHNPLFLQLCMASWDFSPLPISAPHPTTSKQSASNCITLEIPSNFVHLPEHTMPIGAQHSRLHNPHVLSHINVDTSKCILAACWMRVLTKNPKIQDSVKWGKVGDFIILKFRSQYDAIPTQYDAIQSLSKRCSPNVCWPNGAGPWPPLSSGETTCGWEIRLKGLRLFSKFCKKPSAHVWV